MNISQSITRCWTAVLLIVIVALLAAAPHAQAAPLAQAPVSAALIAIEDSGVIESVPTFSAPGNPHFVLNS